jgi:predicted enzyme related to lactoylglutathione lyase
VLGAHAGPVHLEPAQDPSDTAPARARAAAERPHAGGGAVAGGAGLVAGPGRRTGSTITGTDFPGRRIPASSSIDRPRPGVQPSTDPHSIATMERVTGIGGIFQRAGQAGRLREWYAEHLGIDLSEWGGKPFDWTPGGSTTWAIFDHDTEYFGRPDQAFMVNFRVADLDAMLAQLRAGGVEVIDDVQESDFGRFGWAVDPEGTRFELWEPPPGG